MYVADGYGNRRMIVFDADTGEYKRHWGAYGELPVDGVLDPYDPDAEPSPIFGDTVHCVTISNEGLVYVCDRMNHRLQVFQKDGSFVTEGFVGRRTAGASVWDIDFSPDAEQSFVYNADGGNHLLWMLRRRGSRPSTCWGGAGGTPDSSKALTRSRLTRKGTCTSARRSMVGACSGLCQPALLRPTDGLV